VELMRLLLALSRDTGATILLSTHDLELAMRVADRIWLLAKDGEMHEGAPEDLAMQGTFGTVFASEGVVFDRFSGHFQLHDTPRRTASLEGTGLSRIWAERALTRAGYAVVGEGTDRDKADRSVICLGEAQWLVDNTNLAESLGELVRLCR
jgi:iron complex transport system ATP-binding protein